MAFVISNIKYSIFGNYDFLEANPENVSKLYEIFGKEQFLPNMIQLLQVEQPKDVVNRVQRPQFINETMKCVVTFLPDRIDIDVKDGKELELDKVIGYFQEIIESFQLGVNRVALNTSIILNMNSLEDAVIMRNKIVVENSFPYRENMLEWNSRNVARRKCENLNELANIGQNIQSMPIAIEDQILISQIKVDTDINTLAEKKTERFNVESCRLFFIQAENWNREMFDNLEGLA